MSRPNRYREMDIKAIQKVSEIYRRRSVHLMRLIDKIESCCVGKGPTDYAVRETITNFKNMKPGSFDPIEFVDVYLPVPEEPHSGPATVEVQFALRPGGMVSHSMEDLNVQLTNSDHHDMDVLISMRKRGR